MFKRMWSVVQASKGEQRLTKIQRGKGEKRYNFRYQHIAYTLFYFDGHRDRVSETRVYGRGSGRATWCKNADEIFDAFEAGKGYQDW